MVSRSSSSTPVKLAPPDPQPFNNGFVKSKPLPDGPGVAQLKALLEILPPISLKDGPWIAGGAARRLAKGESLRQGDVDFFFKNMESWVAFNRALKDHQEIIKTNRATTYMVNGITAQMIRRQYYLGLDYVFKDFDFSVCQIATDGQQLYMTEQADQDIRDNLIRIAPDGMIAKHTLIQRLTKYVHYGMMPEPGLFELFIKSNLDYVSAYSIFEGEEVSNYGDPEINEEEEMISSKDLDEGVMRTIARKLGLEKNHG